MKAIWNGVILAQSNDTIVVENSHYFPLTSAAQEHLMPSETHTIRPWKGTASYYTIQAGGRSNPDAVWFYPQPKPSASQVADRIAFWKGVQIVSE